MSVLKPKMGQYGKKTDTVILYIELQNHNPNSTSLEFST